MIELYPRCCQRLEPIYRLLNHLDEDITAPPFQPKKDAILVIRPSDLPKSNRIYTTTTTEIKYGRYEIV